MADEQRNPGKASAAAWAKFTAPLKAPAAQAQAPGVVQPPPGALPPAGRPGAPAVPGHGLAAMGPALPPPAQAPVGPAPMIPLAVPQVQPLAQMPQAQAAPPALGLLPPAHVAPLPAVQAAPIALPGAMPPVAAPGAAAAAPNPLAFQAVGPVDPAVAARGYPLGFRSLQEARDLTRPYAQLDRQGTPYVRGSAVTNLSHSRQVPFDAESDIDFGMASPALRHDDDFMSRGGRSFPRRGTDASRTERATSAAAAAATGHTMGFAATDDLPGGAYMVRPHTPPPPRRQLAAQPAAPAAPQAAPHPAAPQAPPPLQPQAQRAAVVQAAPQPALAPVGALPVPAVLPPAHVAPQPQAAAPAHQGAAPAAAPSFADMARRHAASTSGQKGKGGKPP